jgi:hypothetical protein
MKYRCESFLSPARLAGPRCKPEPTGPYVGLVSDAKNLGVNRAIFATT